MIIYWKEGKTVRVKIYFDMNLESENDEIAYSVARGLRRLADLLDEGKIKLINGKEWGLI